MPSLNLVQIIGNLGRDPEMRYTPAGQAVTQFSVATSRSWKDLGGEWQEETTWFRVTCWGDLAERVAEHRRKGHRVYVQGRIRTYEWTNNDGKQRGWEVIADKVLGLDKREDADKAHPGDAYVDEQASRSPAPAATAGSDYDDLPF